MLISCPHHHFSTNVKIHSFKVHIKGLCVNSNSMNLLPSVMNNRNGSTYIGIVHQYFDIRRSGETQVNNGERSGISNARLFLQHDQIMTFDWMWTVL